MIYFVAAMECEAGPLVRRWELDESVETAPFKIYARGEVSLIVSGVGKVACAAAVAHLHASRGGGRDHVWLNVGVGGHRDLQVGYGALAQTIIDQGNGWQWEPPLPEAWGLASATVITVDRAEEDFPEDAIYEMEAAGFCATARRFSPSGLVHCYKVVSDNRETGLSNLKPEIVEELIEARLEEVERLVALVRGGTG